MHQEVINAFIAPAKYVWKQEFGQALTVAATEPVEFEKTGPGITLLCLVEGTLTGSFGLYLDTDTAKALSAAMRGRWVADFEDLMQKTLADMSRKINEQAQPLLNKIGYECTISESMVIEERGLPYPREHGEQTMVRFECDLGTIAMILSFVDSKGDSIRQQVAERRAAEKAAADAETNAAFKATLDFNPDQVPEVVRAKRFEIVAENGATRAILGLLADGSPHVVLADTNGRMRCAIWLAPDGAPQMAFFDADGRRSWLAA